MLTPYKIGVRILAVNGVSPILRVIARDVLGLGTKVDAIGKKFGKWRIAAVGVGVAVAGIGVAALKAEYSLAKMGDRLVKQQQLAKASGMSSRDVRRATTASESVATSVPGTTPAGNLALVQSLRVALGSKHIGEILPVLPQIAKEQFALKAAGYTDLANATPAMLKTLDLLGAGIKNGKFDPKQLAASFRALTQVEILTHGILTPQELLRIGRTGGFTGQGTKFKNWLAENLAAMLELGSRAGSGMGQAAIQFIGGQATVKSVFGLRKYGLLKGGFVNEYGHFFVPPSSLVGGNMLKSGHMTAWIQKVLIPTLQKHGEHTFGGMLSALAQIVGSVRALRYVATMGLPAGIVMTQRDKELALKAEKTSHPYRDMMKTLAGQTKAFSSAFDGLMEVLGAPLVPMAVKQIKYLTHAVLGMEKWAAAHPKLVVKLGKDFEYLGAALVAIGSAAVVAALATLVGPAGLVIGLGLAIKVLANHFKEVKWFIDWMRPSKVKITDKHIPPGVKIHHYGDQSPMSIAGKVIGGWWDGMWGGHFVTKHSAAGSYSVWESNRRAAVPGRHGAAMVPTGTADDPIHTVVTNGKDLAKGITAHQTRGLALNPSGPSGFNDRRTLTPAGLPSLPVTVP